MNPYAYMGAAWGNQANRNRQNAQQSAQMWGQYAPQRQQNAIGWNQLATNQAIQGQNQQGQQFRFGINALTGLMRR